MDQQAPRPASRRAPRGTPRPPRPYTAAPFHWRGLWLKIWIAVQWRSSPRLTAFAGPPAGETCAPISTGPRLPFLWPCASAFLRHRPGRCTSATRGRHCTTGSWPGARAASSSCASRTPTASAPRARTCHDLRGAASGWGSTGTRVRSSRPRTRPATRRSSSGCSTRARPTARQREPTRSSAYKERHDNRGFRGTEESDGAVRLRMPDEGATVVNDIIRGETEFENALLDDLVIARADGTPVYHLAVVVDDMDEGITHVVRGADHYSNTPKHVRIYEALGADVPVYAHLPLLHGPDGKKLSKRHGAASVQDLRDSGYLREAVDQLPRAAWLGLRRVHDVLHHSGAAGALHASSASRRLPPCSTSRSCAGSTAATCASSRSTT